MPFLSIIIPVYKVEPYLQECLDSIAASPLQCWEAILVDDGSPDSCPQICDEYAQKDCRFRVIHQENAGVAAARNAGLDVAQGQWCWFVDSDDLVDMRPIGDMVTWLQEHKDVDLVMFDLKTFKDGSDCQFSILNSQFSISDDHLTKNDFLLKHICYHHPRLWYRTSSLSPALPNREGAVNCGIRFTKGIRLAEDLEFQYKYLTRCQHPVKMDATLYYYRLRETSATGDVAYRAKAVEDLPVVLHNLARWTQENNVKPEPWYDYRIMKLIQNLLYSASLVQNLNTKNFQKIIRDVVSVYKRFDFSFVNNKKIRLATWSVKFYFLFNKVYLILKGFVEK